METISQYWTEIYNNWEKAQKYLKLRVYPKSFREKLPSRAYMNDLVYKIDFENTFTMLVLDYKGQFAPLQKSQATLWGKNLHELYDTAQENTNREKFEAIQTDIGEKKQIYTIHNEYFAPVFLLSLSTLASHMIGKYGSLVGIPAQNTTLICPINQADTLENCQLLNKKIQKFSTEPSSIISQTIYWYFEQIFYPLPYRAVTDEKVCVNIPPKLRMMLDDFASGGYSVE